MLKVFALSLLFTLVIEIAAALLWGLRRKDLLLAALVNLLTNPAVLLLHLLARSQAATLLLEAAAVVTEGLYYRRFGQSVRAPMRFSLAANLSSFLLGLLLGRLI